MLSQRELSSSPRTVVVGAAQDTYQLLPHRGSKNVTCCNAGNMAVAPVVLHFRFSWGSWILCSLTFLKNFYNEPEVVHVAFLFRETTQCFCSEPVYRLLIKNPLLSSLPSLCRGRHRETGVGHTTETTWVARYVVWVQACNAIQQLAGEVCQRLLSVASIIISLWWQRDILLCDWWKPFSPFHSHVLYWNKLYGCPWFAACYSMDFSEFNVQFCALFNQIWQGMILFPFSGLGMFTAANCVTRHLFDYVLSSEQ